MTVYTGPHLIPPGSKILLGGDPYVPPTDPPDPPPPQHVEGALAAYVHVQADSSDTWTVNHMMGYKPAGVYVIDPEGGRHMPSIQHISNNQLLLHFDSAVSGEAYFT